MGGGKGRVKPRIDGITWLEAHRQGRIWGKPHQWRLDELLRIKMELHTFFTCPELDQIPKKIFKRLTVERKRIAEGFYSKPLLADMDREVNAQQISLYQLLLPTAVYSAITSSLPSCGPDRASQHAVTENLLVKLWHAFSALPDTKKKLAMPIGKKLAAGKRRAKGESWKSSDIAGAYIWNVYDLFKPFYSTSKRGWNRVRAKSPGSKFPFALI